MKRLILYLSLIIILAFCFWVVWHRTKHELFSQMVQPLPQPTETQPATNTSQPIVKEPELTRPTGMDDAGWNYLMLVRNLALSENQPVEFYAHVLDQNDSPVAGAKLNLTLSYVDEGMFRTGAFLHKKMGDEVRHKSIDIISDADGWVKLSGVKGTLLNLNTISKDGYHSKDYYAGIMYEPGGKKGPVGDILMTNAFNPDKGYILHLWKTGQTEGLVRVNFGVTIPENGHQIWFNIFNQEISNPSTEWVDFAVVQTMLYPDDPTKPYDQTINIQGMNGAQLLETSDIYPYHAPDDGYQTEFHFDVLPSTGRGPNGTWEWKKNFYIKARDGKIYAGLKVSFIGGKLSFGFDGYLNPNGSHNLEPDENKLITNVVEIQHLDETTRNK